MASYHIWLGNGMGVFWQNGMEKQKIDEVSK